VKPDRRSRRSAVKPDDLRPLFSVFSPKPPRLRKTLEVIRTSVIRLPSSRRSRRSAVKPDRRSRRSAVKPDDLRPLFSVFSPKPPRLRKTLEVIRTSVLRPLSSPLPHLPQRVSDSIHAEESRHSYYNLDACIDKHIVRTRDIQHQQHLLYNEYQKRDTESPQSFRTI